MLQLKTDLIVAVCRPRAIGDGALLQQLFCYQPSQPTATQGVGASSSCHAPMCLPGPCPQALAQDPPCGMPPPPPPPLPPVPTGRFRHEFCCVQASLPSGQGLFAMQPVLWMCQAKWLGSRGQGRLMQHVQWVTGCWYQ